MKKIMIALAIATMSVVANANAVKWGVAAVSPSSGATATTDYTAYLFIASDTSSTFSTYTLAAITEALSAGDTSVLSSAAGYANAGSIVATTGKANWTTQTLATEIDAGNTLSAFLVIVDDTQSNYLVAQNNGSEIMTKTVSSGSAAYSFTFGSQASNANTWQAIPEPTSGLLMLVGLAGLALRRRRA